MNTFQKQTTFTHRYDFAYAAVPISQALPSKTDQLNVVNYMCPKESMVIQSGFKVRGFVIKIFSFDFFAG